MKKALLYLLLLFPALLMGQAKNRLAWTEVLAQASMSPTPVTISNSVIYYDVFKDWTVEDFCASVRRKMPEYSGDSSHIVIPERLKFEGCTFEYAHDWKMMGLRFSKGIELLGCQLQMQNFLIESCTATHTFTLHDVHFSQANAEVSFKNSEIHNMLLAGQSPQMAHLSFADCYLLLEGGHLNHNPFFVGLDLNELRMERTRINGGFHFAPHTVKHITLADCQFSDTATSSVASLVLPDSIGFGYQGDACSKSYIILPEEKHVQSINISRCHFGGGATWSQFSVRGLKISNLFLLDNQFDVICSLHSCNIEERITLSGNTFTHMVSLTNSLLPERNKVIYWSQLQNFKLLHYAQLPHAFKNDSTTCHDLLYRAENYWELSNYEEFEKFINTYQELYNNYRLRGDLRSANACYVEMKELQGRMLQHEQQVNPGLRNWLRWRLNRLMKFYCEHGTDPAKSIAIAIYVVLAFAIFYMFFPSEWDDARKAAWFREWAWHRQEAGLPKALGISAKFMILSMANAFVLSINAFTTLGFGNIPTRGFARYLTIIEGFIGWFLLSIFSVALINQVLG